MIFETRENLIAQCKVINNVYNEFFEKGLKIFERGVTMVELQVPLKMAQKNFEGAHLD